MQIRALILLSCLISGCSPGFEFHAGEHLHCPDGALEDLKKTLEETKRLCASLSATHGDSDGNNETSN